uniref:PUM-HD domain-containing protein n=1 Tax=Globodera pallida TaxID=36090 RepID=A0A183BVL7_GLOPA
MIAKSVPKNVFAMTSVPSGGGGQIGADPAQLPAGLQQQNVAQQHPDGVQDGQAGARLQQQQTQTGNVAIPQQVQVSNFAVRPAGAMFNQYGWQQGQALVVPFNQQQRADGALFNQYGWLAGGGPQHVQQVGGGIGATIPQHGTALPQYVQPNFVQQAGGTPFNQQGPGMRAGVGTAAAAAAVQQVQANVAQFTQQAPGMFGTGGAAIAQHVQPNSMVPVGVTQYQQPVLQQMVGAAVAQHVQPNLGFAARAIGSSSGVMPAQLFHNPLCADGTSSTVFLNTCVPTFKRPLPPLRLHVLWIDFRARQPTPVGELAVANILLGNAEGTRVEASAWRNQAEQLGTLEVGSTYTFFNCRSESPRMATDLWYRISLNTASQIYHTPVDPSAVPPEEGAELTPRQLPAEPPAEVHQEVAGNHQEQLLQPRPAAEHHHHPYRRPVARVPATHTTPASRADVLVLNPGPSRGRPTISPVVLDPRPGTSRRQPLSPLHIINDDDDPHRAGDVFERPPVRRAAQQARAAVREVFEYF